MLFFGRKKQKDIEEDEELLEEDLPHSKKFRDLNSKNRKRRKEPIKPWGKAERYFVLIVLLFTVLTSSILGISARKWKLPGLPQLNIPEIDLSMEKTIVIENNNKKPDERNYSDIKKQIEDLTKKQAGVYSVYFYDLEAQSGFGVNDQKKLQAASLIKLPVMYSFLKEVQSGNFDLDDEVILKDSDKIGGSGSLYSKPAGTSVSFGTLIELMGKQSDNTAFNIVRNTLGDTKITQMMSNIGMNDTSLDENQTTAFDIALFFKKLWQGDLLQKSYSDLIEDSLTKTIYEDWIPSFVSSDTKVVHKYGREVHVINDAGIVYFEKPYVLVIMTDGILEKEAEIIFPEIVRLIDSSHQDFYKSKI